MHRAPLALDPGRPCVVIGAPRAGKSARIADWLSAVAGSAYRVIRVDVHDAGTERALTARVMSAIDHGRPVGEMPLVEAALEIARRARAESPWILWLDGAPEQSADAVGRFADQVAARAKGRVSFVIEVQSTTLALPAVPSLRDDRARVVVLDDASVAERLSTSQGRIEASVSSTLCAVVARACRVHEPARSPFEVLCEARSRANDRPVTIAELDRVWDDRVTLENETASLCECAVRLTERAAIDQPRTLEWIGELTGLNVASVRAGMEELRAKGAVLERAGGDWWSAEGHEGRYASERGAIAITDDEASALVSAIIAMVADRAAANVPGGVAAWRAVYGDGHRAHDETLPCGNVAPTARSPVDPLVFDFRHVDEARRDPEAWSRRSANVDLRGRVVWVAGLGHRRVLDLAADIARTEHHLRRVLPVLRRPGTHLTALAARERGITEHARRALEDLVRATFAAGSLYYRGRRFDGAGLGQAFDEVFAQAVVLAGSAPPGGSSA